MVIRSPRFGEHYPRKYSNGNVEITPLDDGNQYGHDLFCRQRSGEISTTLNLYYVKIFLMEDVMSIKPQLRPLDRAGLDAMAPVSYVIESL